MKKIILGLLVSSAAFASTDDRFNIGVRNSFLEAQLTEQLRLLESVNNSLILIYHELRDINTVAQESKAEYYSQID